MGKLWVGLGAYYVTAGLVVAGFGPAAGWSEPALGLGAAALVAGGIVSTAVVLWRQDGVERQILLEATSVAFLVTVVLAGVSAALGGRLTLSSLWLYDLGIAAWLATTAVRTRQLT